MYGRCYQSIQENEKNDMKKLNGLKKYMVVSEEFEQYSGDIYHYDPPEYGCCVVVVEARTKREARLIAIKQKEMQPWVDLQRDSNKPPMAGLSVYDEDECW